MKKYRRGKMSFRTPSFNVATAYLTGEAEFDRDYFLEGALEAAHGEAALPRVFTYRDPAGYLSYLSGEGAEDFRDLEDFESWKEEAEYLDESIVVELSGYGSPDSTIVLTYEERGHVEEVLGWPSEISTDYQQRIEINLIGEGTGGAEGFVSKYFPELLELDDSF